MITNFEERVYSLIRKVPKGKITTYREISFALGTKAYQSIGNALRKNPYPPSTPCHRVIKSNGSVGGFKGQTKGEKVQEKITLLRSEGVEVKENKVNLNKYLFQFSLS
jgi:methylated-DNA-[protein]-cysteine S-methyltransferase